MRNQETKAYERRVRRLQDTEEEEIASEKPSSATRVGTKTELTARVCRIHSDFAVSNQTLLEILLNNKQQWSSSSEFQPGRHHQHVIKSSQPRTHAHLNHADPFSLSNAFAPLSKLPSSSSSCFAHIPSTLFSMTASSSSRSCMAGVPALPTIVFPVVEVSSTGFIPPMSKISSVAAGLSRYRPRYKQGICPHRHLGSTGRFHRRFLPPGLTPH
jgi:hypothetical protein